MKNINKLIVSIASVLIGMLLMPMMLFAAEGTLTGAGTESDPYIINTVNDFGVIQDGIKDGKSYKNKYFCLESDIKLPADWKPLGMLKEGAVNAGNGRNMLPFSGTLDGNGHTLTFTKGSKPLFGYVRDAKVKNLNIFGTYIDGYGLVENYVVDYGKDSKLWTDDDPKAAITAEKVIIKSGTKILQSGFIGGYASGINHANFMDCMIEQGVIIGCKADGSSAGLSNVGSFSGASNGVIKNCVSYATVYGNNNVGGIAGIRGQSTNTFNIEDCVFHGAINATGNNIGGILGSGYYMYNAPNAFGAVITNCTVDGSVSGKQNVGGIFGAEGGIEQAWDNGVGKIVSNVFSGKVSGKTNVGAIIGYIRALNNNNVIKNNVYTSNCGIDKGLGKVVHVDTDAVNFGMRDGVFYYNTEKFNTYTPEEWNQIYEVVDGDWKDTQRYPGKAIAMPNYNRSDDPLGKDLEKLVKCSDDAVEPICRELSVSGKCKKTYYIGEKLDLTGLTFTAHWTQGKADTTVNMDDITVGQFDNETRGTKIVRLYYGSAMTTLSVNVIKDPTQRINVTFSLLGDDQHDSEKDKITHVLSVGTLKTWLEPKKYNVSANATVGDVLKMVLANNGMSCSNPQGNYVQSITRNGETLGEFDNGRFSGWMYTLNGVHPNFAVDQQYLENDDVIVFHYTDNYYYEESSPSYKEVKTVLNTVQKINNIGTVVLNSNCKNKIDAARSTYNTLSAGQKTLIIPSQLKILTDAEMKYEQLRTDAERLAAKKAQQAALKKKYTPAKTSLKSVKKLKKNQAKLTWKKVQNATGYDVYQSVKRNGGYKKVKRITKNKTVTYKVGKLKKKKVYYFKIRTYRKAGGVTYYGTYSNVKKIKIK
mgnify:CR=1 FL=1